MTKLFTRARVGIVAAAVLAFSIPLLTPKPAEAWWYRGGPGWHAGWGPGYGWHGGWRAGYYGGWRGGYYGPGVVVGVPGPIVIAPPPVYAYGPRPWVRAHWAGPYWVPGHWA